jgi:agmatinase
MTENENYAGIPDEYATPEAAVYLVNVPYDGTSTWGKGADKGFTAFLDASANMELYDIETMSEPYKHGVYIQPAVNEDRSADLMAEAVDRCATETIRKNKIFSMFGGEHSVSIGAIRAHARSFSNLSVLQIDAHADLRKEYHGTACNHACAVHEARYNTNLIQVGIRSMDICEEEHMDRSKVFFAHQIAYNNQWIKEVVSKLTDNVYLTIDLDAFDSSIMPATGTPEPGGLNWYQVIDLIREVATNKKIVGFDIVELAPIEGLKAPDFVAAKLYYKILSYIFHYQKQN